MMERECRRKRDSSHLEPIWSLESMARKLGGPHFGCTRNDGLEKKMEARLAFWII